MLMRRKAQSMMFMIFTCRLWYLALLTTLSSGSILRLPCKKYADFKVIFNDKRLTGSVLMSFYGLQDNQCMVKCVKHEKCRSYNTNKKDGRCEINGKALVDRGANLKTDSNWIYKSTDYSLNLVGPVCISLNPCGEKILCKDSCDPPYYKCVYCDADHEGLHCDIAIDRNECSSNPCQNSGTCVDKFADYQCTCLNGYTGKNCETDIDECASFPCFNGGSCINEIGNYTCNCTPAAGYTGRNCEGDIDECFSNPCQNSGTCVDKLAGYQCTCVNGYTGKNCETVELHVTISSYGKSDPGFGGARSFKVNGVITGTSSRGINVVVLSHVSGLQLGAAGFDTYGNADAGVKLIEYIERFSNGSILLVAAMDSAHAKLPQQTKDYLSNLGSIGINSMHLRSSLALLTAKGKKPAWFAEKFAERGKGPSIIHASLGSPFI